MNRAPMNLLALALALTLAGPALAASYDPADYGAVGDGNADDGPALNAMFAASAEDPEAVIDLTGTWWTRETVRMRAGPRARITAGTLRVHDDARLPVALVVDVGRSCEVDGVLTVIARPSSHLRQRNVVDGVQLHLANGCDFDGFSVEYVARYGVRNAAEPGSNIIGAGLGRVRCSFCGAPGVTGAPPHTRASATATRIALEGSAGSPQQRARVDLSTPLPVLPGDYLMLGGYPRDGGFLTEVVSVDGAEVLVYPWPTEGAPTLLAPNARNLLSGKGPWPAEAIVGGAVRLHGGNTAQVTIDAVYAQYSGHALQMTSLYGGHGTAILAEVVGSGLTVAGRASAMRGGTVRGLHAEMTAVDVLVGGLSVERVVLIAPAEPLLLGSNSWHVRPTLTNGQSAPYPWPVTTVP